MTPHSLATASYLPLTAFVASMFLRCGCWQRENYIGSWDRSVRCGMPGEIVRMSCGLRRCAKGDILPPVDLINCRHAFQCSIYGHLPKHLAGLGVDGAYFTVARAGEDQPTSRYHWRYLRKM